MKLIYSEIKRSEVNFVWAVVFFIGRCYDDDNNGNNFNDKHDRVTSHQQASAIRPQIEKATVAQIPATVRKSRNRYSGVG